MIDEYSLLYLNWVSPRSKIRLTGGMGENFWGAVSQSPAWKAWCGYAFEAICFKHLDQIRSALGIPDLSMASSWHYTPKKNDVVPGAQIDLLFDRDDGLINLCEIKYTTKPFCINKQYAKALKNKLEVYQKVTKTTKQLCLSMITTHGMKPSIH